ncbi:DUF6573 family protein [Nonomuraea sp. JJY05]|uniref:DUF6573 family protein n=1 Tax=Nonomuraea sp. JJY05 TaxID=3350255 RepID=UPI00373E5FA8
MINAADTDLGEVFVIPDYVARQARTFNRTVEVTRTVWDRLVMNGGILDGEDFQDRYEMLLWEAHNHTARMSSGTRAPLSVARTHRITGRFVTELTVQFPDDDPRSRVVIALASELPAEAPSRADRIASGDLVEIPAELSREAGLRFPTALTRAAWEDCVAWSDADNRRKGTVQDETGRLWDVLWMTCAALRSMPPGNRRATVRLHRTPRDRRIRKAHPATLIVSVSHEGGQQVIIVSHPSEA